jgi:hypothetical protein
MSLEEVLVVLALIWAGLLLTALFVVYAALSSLRRMAELNATLKSTVEAGPIATAAALRGLAQPAKEKEKPKPPEETKRTVTRIRQGVGLPTE